MSAAAYGETNGLNFKPLDADYSRGLDRIIMISAEPNQLHIYDPATGGDSTINLPKTPANLSLSTDGLHAAVMHDGLIAYIDLSTAAIEKLIPVTVSTGQVVLGDGYVYVIPGYNENLISANLATGTVQSLFFLFGSGGKYNPYTKAIYGTRDGTSPNDIERYDVSTGPITQQTDSPYHGDYPACGTTWFSPDWQRIYNGCGTVYRASQNSQEDMTYATTLAGINGIQSLSTSESRKWVAAIPSSTQFNYPTTSQPDNQVMLYESDYLNPIGVYRTPDFIVGNSSFQSHARWVFFNKDSSSMEVILQADSKSNMKFPYAVYSIPLATPEACTATFASTNAQIAPAGTLAAMAVTAPSDCTYNAVSSVPWIQVISGGFGSGNSTLIYLVRPNHGTAARSGTITLGGATLTVNQDKAATYNAALTNLSFKLVTADYSKSRDKLVMASSGPNELHLYDAGSASESVIPLVKEPFSLSVSPDGLHAAVGHDGWISYVNLVSVQVEKVFSIDTDVHSILLAGNGYIYAFPQRDWSDIYSLEISTGIITNTSAIYEGRIPRLDPSGDHIYLGGNWSSKWDISTGILKQANSGFGFLQPSPLACGNFWLSPKWGDVYNACGTVYNDSDAPANDLTYRGEFPQPVRLQWAAESPIHNTIAVIDALNYDGSGDDTKVYFYGDDYLDLISQTQIPAFSVSSSQYAAHGKFVFWDYAENKLFVISEADAKSGLISDFGLTVLSMPNGVTNCAASVNPTTVKVAQTGGFETVALTIPDGCGWSASGPSWLTIDGTYGAGSGQVMFDVAPNDSPDARTGKLQVAGQTVTIQQDGEPQSATNPEPPAPPSKPGGAAATPTDFDGDGKSDVAVWRPANGTWYVVLSSNPLQPVIQQWGLRGDVPVPADFDHDGKIDFAVWRPANGTWYVIPSSQPNQPLAQQWGLPGDTPVPADFDHDGKIDFAVWRPANGTWYVIPSSRPDEPFTRQWGLPGDVPVPADYDHDGKIDFAVWRPANGTWYVIPSSQPDQPTIQQWGLPGDTPVPGDYDHDGKIDFAVWRPVNGTWYIIPSSKPDQPVVQQWGLPGDTPVPGDFDHDGKTDFAVWRPGDQLWYFLLSSKPGQPILQQWGLTGDVPLH